MSPSQQRRRRRFLMKLSHHISKKPKMIFLIEEQAMQRIGWSTLVLHPAPFQVIICRTNRRKAKHGIAVHHYGRQCFPYIHSYLLLLSPQRLDFMMCQVHLQQYLLPRKRAKCAGSDAQACKVSVMLGGMSPLLSNTASPALPLGFKILFVILVPAAVLHLACR